MLERKSSELYTENVIIIFILLLLLIEPDGIHDGAKFGGGYYEYLHVIFNYGRYLSMAYSGFLLCAIRRPSPMLWSIFVYQVVIVLSSLSNECLKLGYINNNVLVFFSLSIIAEYYLKNAPLIFLKALSILLMGYVLLNFLTIIMFPRGLYVDDRWWNQNWFLGYKNLHVYYFLPLLLSIGLYQYVRFRDVNKYYYILLILLAFSCLLNQSTTSLIVIVLFLVTFLFLKNFKFPRWLNANIVFWFGGIISFFMVSLTVGGYMLGYTEIVSMSFDKDIDTLGSRTIIWIEALMFISKSPLWGVGTASLDVGWLTDVTQMHNQYLDVLFLGGVILLGIFFLQIFLMSRSMSRIKDFHIFNLLLFILFAYSVEFLTEGKRNHYLWYIVLMTVYHTPYIIDNMLRHKKIKDIILKYFKKDENYRSNSRPLQVK